MPNHFLESFEFLDRSEMEENRDSVREIPAGLSGKRELLDTYYERLQFPGYFGFNWDALWDCLLDLHWLEPGTIVVRHRDLPALPPDESQIYIRLLAEAVLDWRPDELRALRIQFPMSAREEVARILKLGR